MYFSFRYWAQLTDDGELILGACLPPVTGGKGGFAGANGFLGMVDTPTNKPPFSKTRYERSPSPDRRSRVGRSAHC
jgi:hypothetical protein